MRKMIVWILALAMLAGARTAAAESRQPPEIPDFQGTLNVRPIRTEEEAIAYAKEIWALDYLGMDFPIACYEADRYEENSWVVYAKDGPEDGDYCFGDVIFETDGSVVRVENASSGIFEIMNEAWSMEKDEDALIVVPEDDDTWAEWRSMLDKKLEYPFLETVCPRVYEEYTALYPTEEVNNDTLTHYFDTLVDSYDDTLIFDINYSEQYRDETWCIQYAVQTSPVIRIVYFNIYTDAEEGGNG